MSRPKNADAEETRRRVLAASRQIAAEQGLRAMTIDAIASRAGVSKGTVGQFKIDALIEDIIDCVFVPLVIEFNQTAPRKEGAEVPFHDRIDAIFADEPEAAALVMQACALAAGTGPKGSREQSWRDRFARVRDCAARLIVEGSSASRSADWSQHVVAYYLSVALRVSLPS